MTKYASPEEVTAREGWPGEDRSRLALSGWMGCPSTRRRQSIAFTLVELMVVVVVIGIIAGIVLAAAGGVQKKAARDQTKAEIRMICVALESYKATHGTYPTHTGSFTTNFYANLTNFLSWKTNQIRGTGATAAILDPYNNAYRYRSPSLSSTTMLSDSFEVWSPGPNMKSNYDTGATSAGADSLDDLTSWQ